MSFAAIISQYPDDQDCQVKSPLVDERPPQCFEVCREGKAWFMWGKRTYCYWDDDNGGEAD